VLDDRMNSKIYYVYFEVNHFTKEGVQVCVMWRGNTYLDIQVSLHADSSDPRGLRRGSLAGFACSSPVGDMNVSCECCVMSGGGLCLGLITRPVESCRVWCV